MNLVTDEVEAISEDLFFVTGSPAMRRLRTQAELLAGVNVPVLILGESGSGKEIAARLIHKLSPRSKCMFLKVNCAALPGDLLESELFGYERGAFTGAMQTREGKFELCDGGTILLDEIAEMPPALQAKLLHVLQDNQFFRLGGNSMIRVDVRIMAATNVNVERALAEKRFREDLYYRLSAFKLHVPPLRERKEEIPVLLAHFIQQLARHYNLQPRPLSPMLLNACREYSWPGNLRELENVVKRYLVMGDDFLEMGELSSKSDLEGHGSASLESNTDEGSLLSGNGNGRESYDLKSILRTVKGDTERSAIVIALERTGWNRKAAARELGISYRGLLYKIQEYQLIPPTSFASNLPNSSSLKRNGSQH